MGGSTDQQKKQQNDSDRLREGAEVDLEGEHDAKRARMVSNAALRRIADAGSGKKATPDPKALHEKASSKTYESVQSGLMLLAKEMHLARTELVDAQKDDPVHNNANGMATIERIVHMISADAMNLNATLGTVDFVSTMGPEIKTVAGAWFQCQPEVVHALNWYRGQKGTAQTSVDNIEPYVNAMIQKLGATPAELAQDRKEPDGDAKVMSDKAFEDELVAATATLDGYVAGNEQDGKRLIALTQHIGVKGGYSAAFKRDQKQVIALAARIEEARTHDKANKLPALGTAWSQLETGLKQK